MSNWPVAPDHARNLSVHEALAIPSLARPWIALLAGLFVVAVGGYSVISLTANSAAKEPKAQAPATALGSPEDIGKRREALIEKYMSDFKLLHLDAPTEPHKLRDSAESYINDRIAQTGENWRYDKTTGKPDTLK